MKRSGHRLSLPHYDWIVSLGRHHFYSRAQAFDFGGADEDHLDGRSAEQTFADGTVNLATVGVAADCDVNCAQAGLGWILDFFGEEDCARARAEARLAVHKFF